MKNLDRRLRESGSQYFLLGLKTLKIGWIEFEESGSMVDSRGISGDLSCFCVLSFVLILLSGEDEVKAHTLVYICLFYIHLFLFIYRLSLSSVDFERRFGDVSRLPVCDQRYLNYYYKLLNPFKLYFDLGSKWPFYYKNYHF